MPTNGSTEQAPEESLQGQLPLDGNPDSGLNEQLERGIDLYREIHRLTEELDDIKNYLRTAAEARKAPDQTTVELTTDDEEHTVFVTFPKDRLEVTASDERLEEVRESLGDGVFNVFFHEHTRYSVDPEFEENLEAIKSPLQQEWLKGSVEKKASTPRVQFPK